jgi:acyl transferase domain-containing protein
MFTKIFASNRSKKAVVKLLRYDLAQLRRHLGARSSFLHGHCEGMISAIHLAGVVNDDEAKTLRAELDEAMSNRPAGQRMQPIPWNSEGVGSPGR